MKGFISYAHADYGAYRSVHTHLRAVERSLGIDFWADDRIAPGDRWNATIKAAIDDAQVHLLLMSPNFLASDYIFERELPAILAWLPAGDLVIPVILQDCLWASFVGLLQAVPKDLTGTLKPILKWRPREDGYHEANKQISEAIERRFSLAPKPLF